MCLALILLVPLYLVILTLRRKRGADAQWRRLH